MIYLQLAQPEENFDRLLITEFHYSGSSITFKYQIYKDEFILGKYRMVIRDESDVDKILNSRSDFLGSSETVQKAMLEYLIEKEIKSGTIEVENG